MKKIIVLLLLLLTFSGVQAQENQTVNDRIDQAMTHLSQYLGLSTTITRQSNYWTWEEIVYTDSAFGCPVPNQSYAATPNRALNILITYQGTDYNYRISWDGTLMVLCGANGVPLFRSDDPNYAPSAATNPTPNATPALTNSATTFTPTGNVFTWVYMQQQRVLYLIGLGGELASVQRPTIPNENFDAGIQMAISRNGRYLLQVVTLTTGGQALGIYDLQTGQQRIIPAQAGEEITLGYGTNVQNSGNVRIGSTLIFNATSTQAAVGFASVSTPQPGNNWRIAVIDLATGTTVNELTRTTAQSLYSGPTQFNSDSLNTTTSAFFSTPVYFNDDGGVHFQLIQWFTGGAISYPTFVWYPSNNILGDSPYTHSGLDILPSNDSLLRIEFDATQPNAGEQVSMIPNYNIILSGSISGNQLSGETRLLNGSATAILDANWAADGNQVAFVTSIPPDFSIADTSYNVLDVASQTIYQLEGTTVGAPGGVLTVLEGAESPAIAYYQNSATSIFLWDAPPQNGDPVFVWVKPSDVTLGFTSVSNSATTTSTSTAGADDCGDHENNGIAIGVVARTTIDDGNPLNMRNNVGTTGTQVSRIIPEGDSFLVIAGPRCADGYTWWNIRLNDGITGWVAQAGQDFFWIEPVPAG